MEILLFFLFCTKHFIVDFLLQRPYQYLNKGIYGHPGGIVHASLHVVGTIVVIYGFLLDNPWIVLGIAFGDGIIHYHIDWAKINTNKVFGWTCDKSPQFWYLMGFDQYLHYLTYILIVLGLTLFVL